MFARTKEFIESHKNLINQNKFYDLFKAAAKDTTLVTHELNELAFVLEEALGVTDLDSIRWQVFESEVKDYIDYYQNLPSYMRNKSNDWSRLDYMLDEISNIGFGAIDAKNYVIKNGKRMGLNILQLDPEYGWEGAGDYDLGWFDPVEFEEENPDV
jgi:hypothetical protein